MGVVDVYGYYMASSGTGEQGPTGPQGGNGAQGPEGPQGPAGTGITAKGSIEYVGKPLFNGTETGDVWIDTNNDAWVWTEDNNWDNVGKISGPAGADGANGQDGANGKDGVQGPEGPEGPIGTGITARGSLEYVGPPTDKDNPESGDVWIDFADDAWVWTDEGEWDNVGPIKGPKGDDGATGSKGDTGDTGSQGEKGADGQDGVDAKPARVIWVADDDTGDFKSLSAALASITDASATKPYLIKIAPGVYTETANVEMKNYVDVEGSGQDITTIECACTGFHKDERASVISAGITAEPEAITAEAGAITAELRHLTVSNTGGSQDSGYGIYMNGVTDGSFSMLDMTVTATSTSVSTQHIKAVYSKNSAYTMDNVTVIASAGKYNQALNNEGDTGNGTAVLNNVTVTALNGTYNTALYNYETSAMAITNATISATGGATTNYGVASADANFTIQNSSITGASNSIDIYENSVAKIANTKLDGPVEVEEEDGATLACSGAYNAAFETLNETCT